MTLENTWKHQGKFIIINFRWDRHVELCGDQVFQILLKLTQINSKLMEGGAGRAFKYKIYSLCSASIEYFLGPKYNIECFLPAALRFFKIPICWFHVHDKIHEKRQVKHTFTILYHNIFWAVLESQNVVTHNFPNPLESVWKHLSCVELLLLPFWADLKPIFSEPDWAPVRLTKA